MAMQVETAARRRRLDDDAPDPLEALDEDPAPREDEEDEEGLDPDLEDDIDDDDGDDWDDEADVDDLDEDLEER